jgi:hypothetical protein
LTTPPSAPPSTNCRTSPNKTAPPWKKSRRSADFNWLQAGDFGMAQPCQKLDDLMEMKVTFNYFARQLFIGFFMVFASF